MCPMVDNELNSPTGTGNAMKPTATASARGAKPRALYRTILSLAVAAVIAASLPFAAIYSAAVSRPPAVAALSPGSSSGGRVLVTTASGRQVLAPASANGSAAAAAPVRTRTSASSSSD